MTTPMQDTRLIALLQTFDRREQRELRKFTASPFFNQRQDVVGLLDLLLGCLNDAQSLPDKAETHLRLYGPDMPFDDHRVRMAMSFLLKGTEQYLVHTEFFGDEVKVKTKLAEVYRRRNLPKHFERAMREAQAVQQQSPHRNAEFFNADYHVQMEQYRFAATNSRTAEHNLQAITDNLDLTYFAQKLRQACLLLSHQAVYKTDYQFGMLEEVLAHVESQQLLGVPAIAVYYFCYRALTQPEQPDHFRQLKKLLVEECEKFPQHEIADLYLLAINFCIRHYNQGNPDYVADEFDLYREGLKRSYFLNNGTLSRFTYRNVVTVGLKVQAFDWVENFVNEFKEKLEPKHRESMYSFNLARLAYERRSHGAALRLLQKSEYADLLLNLAAKALVLKIFYETGELDALDSHLSAMQKFIRRKKVMGYHRENYLNLVLFTKKLMETHEKPGLAALRQEIEGTKSVAEKEWLMGEVG
ncbi:MAG: hypothetical protein HY842_05685 [Bacteroidetes bacterium]|nr:hypothetical protein [Bacteroidota bacterium]